MSHGSTVTHQINSAIRRLLQAGIITAQLDAELLVSHALKRPRVWLLAHSDYNLSLSEISTLDELLSMREKRIPLAYIRGYVEFYGRKFKVTPDVLIPRPETELLIESAIKLNLGTRSKIIDVGTGSGAIAVTLGLETSSHIEAVDISDAALGIASTNATNLSSQINLYKSDLLTDADTDYDLIIANLPYVDRAWDRSPETDHEPDLALFASDEGLDLISRLCGQADSHLKPGGYLILEADPRQHDAITLMNAGKFELKLAKQFCLVFRYVPT